MEEGTSAKSRFFHIYQNGNQWHLDVIEKSLGIVIF